MIFFTRHASVKIARAAIAAIFIFTAFFFCAPVLADSEDDDIENYQKQIQDPQNNISEKVRKELESKGIKLDDPAAVSNVMKQFQTVSGVSDESASSGLYWFFMIFISVVGMGFFSVGKRNEDPYFMVSGAVMMVYPYFVSGTFALVAIGIFFTAAPFFLRYYSASGR
jgi:hypothetical protein